MVHLAWLLTTFALLGVASPLLSRSELVFFAPDVALLAALYIGTASALVPGLLTVFAIGLLKDGFALAAPVGLYTEICVLAFLLGRSLAGRVDLRSTVPLMATAAAASLGATALFIALEMVFDRAFETPGEAARMALPLAMVTMLAAPVVFGAFDRLAMIFDRRRGGMRFG